MQSSCPGAITHENKMNVTIKHQPGNPLEGKLIVGLETKTFE